MKLLGVARKAYGNFEELFCAFCMSVMVACLMLQVGFRWVGGTGMAWTEELSRYAFIWTVFIAAALVAKHNAHVRISAQYGLMPVKARLALLMTTDALWVVCNLYFAWLSWNVIQSGLLFPEISPTLRIARGYVEMIVPFGFLLMSWRIIEGYLKRMIAGTLHELFDNTYNQ
ncbi:TRAP transporter small permease [Halomonas heilongjiangensis]|uniref:TRAP transporter small permease protein n=1 Tax=Halomonas heilongjiangensis TaxID=1387883 RepID=A0A2N7TJ90_9GAMM|nr:TRAP transporter small permease [Halomonas heilongjiangensis]PMR68254.1 TRAP transporter small permease [Halomonas heilongjiangensis]PXX93220.1 C4-dicarboxylate ABC transporter substrate-binding protein [Halomonas heilongjiangensis]